MHIDIKPRVELRWGGGALAPQHGEALIALLRALERAASLVEAARAAGVSYRHAWGLLGAGERAFGEPLAELQRGRGARLTALGRKLLQADARVKSALEAPLERLRCELAAQFESRAAASQPRLAVYASHDLALPLLAGVCAPRLQLTLSFRGAEESLAALARGDCDAAGFHVADALPRAAAAAAALGRWLDPSRHQLVHFVTREQGIIVRPGARVRGLRDLARPGIRFFNRPAGAQEDVDILVATAVAEGRADASFGLRAAAARHGLAFVPLATERYYLAMPRRRLRAAPYQGLLLGMRSAEFAQAVARLAGYDAAKSGTREPLGAALAWLRPPRAGRHS